MMNSQWDLDSLTPEDKEIFRKDSEEALLKRECFNWLSHDNRGPYSLDPCLVAIGREYDPNTLALLL